MHRVILSAASLLTIFKIAGLVNIASNYLIAGSEAGRHGTAHPSIVPYQVGTVDNLVTELIPCLGVSM
jgi:hypothetical protein